MFGENAPFKEGAADPKKQAHLAIDTGGTLAATHAVLFLTHPIIVAGSGVRYRYSYFPDTHSVLKQLPLPLYPFW